MVKVALIGAGDRGKDRYGAYILKHDTIEIVAVAEPDPIKREAVRLQHNIEEHLVFESWEGLLALDKFCDGVIIATSDHLHFSPTIEALKKDYDVLLEKPMSNSALEVHQIGEAEKTSKGKVLVCHVLRYTPFYQQLKAIIESGQIGDVMTIQHNENIGYYHFAHSFVRGNWRNTKESSPLILAKSCHDMDMLLWLAGDVCQTVSSFGSLKHFKSRDDVKATRCLSCEVEVSCPFAAQKIYYPNVGHWPTSTITPIQTKEAVVKALEEGPYGRCVYACDNDVVDHQVSIFEFENGVTATFNLSAFTNDISRSIKIMGTKGVIKGKDGLNEISVQLFGESPILIVPEIVEGGHGGGDTGIMHDFVSLLEKKPFKGLTNAQISLGSHMMSFAAETSRVSNTTLTMKDFIESLN